MLVSCISSCGRCANCRAGRYGQCRNGGGWILGNLIDGTQAEYVRRPVRRHLHPPAARGGVRRGRAAAADILPTSYEVGVLAGQVSPGKSVAIVGAGPIGLAAITTANCSAPARSS